MTHGRGDESNPTPVLRLQNRDKSKGKGRAMGMPNISVNVLDSPDKVADFWLWLTSHHDYVGCDTETTGTDVYEPGFKCRLVQFGDPVSGWAIPYQGWQNLVHGALDWLKAHSVRLVFHNAAYDLKVFHQSGYDIDYSLVDDTYVWALLCGYAEDSRALKTIANREFGGWTKFGQALLHKGMENAGWTWATVPMNYKPYVAYGAIDPIITAMYYELLGKRDNREKFRWQHSLEMSAIEITNRMVDRGTTVNTLYCEEQIAALTAREDALLQELHGYGIESPNQNRAVAKVLADAGVLPEIIRLTATGQIAVDKAFLSKVEHPAAKAVLASRNLHKTKSYLENMIKSANGELGKNVIIHPEIRSIAARTSRMSVSSPALQQLPAPDPDDPDTLNVRKAIVPRSEDESLVGADFGQIELRMFASLSNDRDLMGVLNNLDKEKAAGNKQADFFVHLGQDLYAEPDFKKSDPRRGQLKATCVPLDVPILTRSGWKMHDQVVPGDETIGYNPETGMSEWTPIKHVIHIDNAPLVRLHDSGRFDVVTTPDHRWPTLHDGVFRWRTTESITAEDVLVVGAPLECPDAFQFIQQFLHSQRESMLKAMNGTQNHSWAGAEGTWTNQLHYWLTFCTESKRISGYELTRYPQGTGPVWCVETGLGSWTMQQHGIPYLTGNCYSSIYGAGEEKIAETAKVSVKEIHHTMEQLKSKYHSFEDLGASAIKQVGQTWQVETPTGRVIRVHNQSERRKLNNYRIQGHSAEILKMALVNARECGLGDYLMLPVHDEIIMSVPKDKAKDRVRELKEAMDAVVDRKKYGVGVTASPAEPADDWGDLSH